MSYHFIGIDPGMTGAIVHLSEGRIMRAETMPVMKWTKGRNMVDSTSLSNLLRAMRGENAGDQYYAAVELVHATPQMGVTSAFSFGAGWGIICGVLAGLSMPFTLVRPQEWQKVMLAGMPKGSEQAVALQLWPSFEWVRPGCKKPHEGIIDAALMAEYERRVIQPRQTR
jgi:crossover junction endodeoxyribonuclease RuvC